MGYLNTRPGTITALAVEPFHANTSLAEYDINFEFPVKPLESDGVHLEPLIPSMHAKYLYSQISSTGAKTFRYFGTKLPASEEEYLTHLEQVHRSNPGVCNFVIYDKTYTTENNGKGKIAGSIAYMAASSQHLTIEIGLVLILPEFQRTHVNTHAAGLLMQYALDGPPDGLGLRRVEWQAHSLNVASQRAALRLGFTPEGILRFQWRLLPGKEGNLMLPGDDRAVRHGWYASVTILDWIEEGKREHLAKLMAREVVVKS